MKLERIAGTQSSLFDELPNGQKMLFNMIPPGKRSKSPSTLQASQLELIGDDIDRQTADRRELAGQSRLF